MDEIKIGADGPGAIGRVVELHGTYYAANWQLGRYFESTVAVGIGRFFLQFDGTRDGVWIARSGEQVVGSIFIVGEREPAGSTTARLRWFIIDPAFHGQGLGRRLLDKAVEFCKERHYKRIYLTTFEGLDSARHLYEQAGFVLCGEADGAHLTGAASLIEQEFEYVL